MRPLHLTSPYMHGKDVEHFQRETKLRLERHGRGDIKIDFDGIFGPSSAHAASYACWLLGVSHEDAFNNATRRTNIILHPRLRTAAEIARGRQREKSEKARLTTGASGAVDLALQMARHLPHYTENPPGSNDDGGGPITVAQKEVGISHSFYCGAGYHYLVLHGGGVLITPEVRYCPYAINHAKAGTGGLAKWIPQEDWRQAEPGDGPVYMEGGIGGHIEMLVEKITNPNDMHTVGWNTSAQGGSGSQSNGGGIFERHRPIAGGFPVMGWVRPRWAKA